MSEFRLFYFFWAKSVKFGPCVFCMQFPDDVFVMNSGEVCVCICDACGEIAAQKMEQAAKIIRERGSLPKATT